MLAWLIGLFLAPSAPDPFGSAVTINAYFSAHRPAAMIQSVFIHGLAGVALLGLTAALWSYLAARDTAGPRGVMLAAGVLAAAVSFLQVAFMIAIPAGDHHVRLYEEGAGSPVVVIIAGAGDCADHGYRSVTAWRRFTGSSATTGPPSAAAIRPPRQLLSAT